MKIVFRQSAWHGKVELTVLHEDKSFTQHVFPTQKLAAQAFGVQSNQLSDIWRRGHPVQTKLGLVYSIRRVI